MDQECVLKIEHAAGSINKLVSKTCASSDALVFQAGEDQGEKDDRIQVGGRGR